MSVAAYIRLCVLENSKTQCSDIIKQEWIEAAKKFGYPNVQTLIDQAINGLGAQTTITKPDEKSLQEIKYLKFREKKLESELFELRKENIKPRTEGFYIGQESEIYWLLILIQKLREAKGKWVSENKFSEKFEFSDDNDKEHFKEAIWKYLINMRKIVEYNNRYGFRLKEGDFDYETIFK